MTRVGLRQAGNEVTAVLTAFSRDTDGSVCLTAGCVTYTELEYGVKELIAKLETLLVNAKKKYGDGLIPFEEINGLVLDGTEGWIKELSR